MKWFCLIIITLMGVVGCKAPQPQSALRTTQMKLGTKTFTQEIAATETAREYGLMKRDSMPEDHGMIFVFKGREFNPFWMKNTRIPLDILYIDADAKVIVV